MKYFCFSFTPSFQGSPQSSSCFTKYFASKINFASSPWDHGFRPQSYKPGRADPAGPRGATPWKAEGDRGPHPHHQLPGREAPQNPHHHVQEQAQREAKEQDGARQASRPEENTKQEDEGIACSAPPPELNSRFSRPSGVFPNCIHAGKSNESFPLLSELLLETMPENQPSLSTNQAAARTWAGDVLRVCCYS